MHPRRPSQGAPSDKNLQLRYTIKTMRTILTIDNLSLAFGGLKALDAVSFTVPGQKIVGLIGPNGAGKTTIFNAITRMADYQGGTILFQNQSLKKTPPHKIAAHGIARTFQTIRLFSKLTVLENVLIGTQHWSGNNFSQAFHTFLGKANCHDPALDKALQELAFMGLLSRTHEIAGNLSYGEQRRLEMARALAAKPTLLLLDEPAAGMNPIESDELAETISRITQRGLSVLLIEHHMKLVMNVSHKVVVLNYGQKIAEGEPEAIQKNPAVQEAYLGVKNNAFIGNA